MAADPLAKWKAADAARKRQQRAQRWKRKHGVATVRGAGMTPAGWATSTASSTEMALASPIISVT